jgi:hypothetical protein
VHLVAADAAVCVHTRECPQKNIKPASGSVAGRRPVAPGAGSRGMFGAFFQRECVGQLLVSCRSSSVSALVSCWSVGQLLVSCWSVAGQVSFFPA